MRKVLLSSLVLLGGLMSGTMAQDTASAVPAALKPVYDPCVEVSRDPPIADKINGICITATKQFIKDLAAPPSEVREQLLTDLVVALGELPRGDREQCKRYDDEIAEAIRLAARAVTSQEQAAQFEEVAATVASCTDAKTAAIPAASATPE